MRSRSLIIGLTTVLCAAVGVVVLPPGAQAVPADRLGYAWGYNSFGSVGDGTTDERFAPVPFTLPGGDRPVQVAVGHGLSIALGEGGAVYAWGANNFGQVGDGTTTTRTTPVPVTLPAGATATAVAAAWNNGFALGSDGTVYSWGYGGGALGDGSNPTSRPLPGPVSLPAGVTATSIAASSDALYALATGSDGKVYAWGQNYLGQLGDGSYMQQLSPVAVSLPGGVAAQRVFAGGEAAFALGADGHLYGWGENSYGQVGDGTGVDAPTPVQVNLPGNVTVADVGAAEIATLAVGSDHHLYAWGSNQSYQLGDDRSRSFSSLSPVTVTLPGGVGVTTVSAASEVVHAVDTEGVLYGWGDNNDGSVGDGTRLPRTSPVVVHLPDDAPVTALADGYFTTLVVADALPRPPQFVAAAPALMVPAGMPFTAQFTATGRPAPAYSLAPGAPGWLSIDAATGLVTGDVPADATGFTFAVTATNSEGTATTLPSTVAVGQTVPLTGSVTTAGAPVANATVQACGQGVCTSATTDGTGAYSVPVVVGSSVKVTAYPPVSTGGFPRTVGPLTVAAPGGTAPTIDITPLHPVVAGVALPNLPLSGTNRPTINWTQPTAVSVQGCPNGIAALSVAGADTSGRIAYTTTLLPETPVGSGTYTGTLPALMPLHGAASVHSHIACLPSSPLVPSIGAATGGDQVTLSGSGFTGAKAVTFGGTPVPFTVLDDTLIQTTAPAGAGTVDVTVTPVSGADIVVGSYAYEAVTAVGPASGPTAGGTTVTLTGTGLGNADAVFFGTTPADFVQVSDTQIQATAPAGTGTVDVTVQTPFGTTPATTAARYSYQDGLAAARGAVRTIPLKAAAPVKTVAAPRTTARAALSIDSPLLKYIDKKIKEKITDLFKDAAKDRLEEALKAEAANRNCETSRAVEKERLKALLHDIPAKVGTILTGAVMQIILDTVLLNPVLGLLVGAAVYLLVKTMTQVSFDAFYDFAVDAWEGKCKGTVTPADAQVYIDPSGTVQDRNGNPIAGATVTLLRADQQTGPYAAPATGDIVMQPSVNPETTGADGVFHWDVLSGFYEVRASAPGCADPADPGQPAVTIGPFAVPPPRTGLSIVLACAAESPAPVPSVTELGSHLGTPTGGDTVTITGTGFTPAATVAFGATPAAVTYYSPELLSVVTPAGSGPVDVTVHTAGGTSPVTGAGRYFYGDVPVVTGLSSTQGLVTGGTPITVTGTGFTGATAVLFGGQPATDLTVVSGTEIHATIPPGSLGVADVTVANPAGVSAVTTADRYTYTGSAPVFVSGASATFTAGTGGTFTPTASGMPTPTLSVAGTLPSGVTFAGGVLTVGASAAAGTSQFSFIAANGIGGQVAQVFTLTVNPPPSTGTAPAVDSKATGTGMNTATAKITPTVAGELLVAYVAADGPSANNQAQSATVTSNRGITWTLVRRTNTQHGTAEIWTARAPATLSQITVTSTLGRTVFNQQLTVVAYTHAGGVGASAGANATTGAPTVNLVTTAAKSWVFAVGNDWDRSVNRTVAAGQTIHAQGTDSAGDTYWVQSTAAPTPAAGTVVTISDTAPVDDRWNLTAVEILGQP